MTNTKKMADIAPFGLRMQTEIKAKLEREAKINGRSLNAEIVSRLQISLDKPGAAQSRHVVAEPSANSYLPEINDIERQLLMIFRRMPVEKQLALLSLFN
ncbi:MAG: hypothetical protein B7Y56_03365 [Gallionellales bacterium 35-53-114]|jgi:hypothetical protein|nr:MAG: hypothetical protein B7Y56_03365 [Gallionellales bacterium 35-53-114]OYZ65144.1 MAG: hypothetical protein B7Y04_00525 [Gallionellales bacterium 24-53-125]OZB08052.1 MAG: hypothetical protein B7X61_10975 [Gallionellales bacterium 39-52-133]HQS59956.1 Arc family DNA-binding protein [Gallionellaceae bacterium]HQS76662.1 Arc family DNA-binding protein [Gallionellaceae bacterium]